MDLEIWGPEMKHGFVHEQADNRIEALTSQDSDQKFEHAIVEYVITRGPPPYKLHINHDARQSPAPIKSDWHRGHQCGIELRTTGEARHWIREALRAGYEVTRSVGHHRHTQGSIEQLRRVVTHRERAREAWKLGHDVDDDEIPF